MTDKSKKHEIVEYTSRKKETVVLPTCLTHKKNRCETYCKDCKLPICIQCLMGSHKKHEFTDILDTLEKMRKQIISDTNELQNTIVPKYQNINPTLKFDQVLSAIEEQEDKICKAVYEASIKLKDKISEEKDEAEKMSRESLSLADRDKKEIMQIIKNNKDIISGNDPTAIINYQSKNEKFQQGPKLPRVSCPQLLPGTLKQDQIDQMMGFLKEDIWKHIPTAPAYKFFTANRRGLVNDL
ncbi:tripartite motif-containing protein 67-like [Saccostrea cucullata]|uniref:tripartite motif-containing protein 67-like n=1 Tax=Saccostrea cuccullata TaxID=36930 RepID=UPI002ED54CA9